jgi:hypothetical protein
MPLSDHEQEVLEALGKSLVVDDPGFARRVMTGGPWRSPRQRLTFAVAGLLAGLGLLLAFCVTTAVVLGVLAFLLMFASLYGLWNYASERMAAKTDSGVPDSWRRRRSWTRGRRGRGPGIDESDG